MYTDNNTVQIMISLLKSHGIKKIVISPGTTNFMFVASVQKDNWFDLRSSADERSAAYIACGWAAETGEAVVVSCTGATASRNYMPALTEAYYRKLPVLALTSINNSALPENNTPQVLDRSVIPNDIARISVNITEAYDEAGVKKNIVLANKAILELFRAGGGPVHINLATKMTGEMNTKELPKVRSIRRYFVYDELPSMDSFSKIGIFIGAHSKFNSDTTYAIERFCNKYNAVVLCDHTSNYHGKHKILNALVDGQEYLDRSIATFDLLIDLGEITGNYYIPLTRCTWRVSIDGEVKDRFGNLNCVFEMPEKYFFEYYEKLISSNKQDIYKTYAELDSSLREKMPELPFSNIWVASMTANRIEDGSVLHLGILNSLRAWNFFPVSENVDVSSNVGGFGIDGPVSTLIGASFSNPQKTYYGVVGDLAFFYDMNSIGNRYVGNNIRLIVVNNGKGTEFRNYSHPASALGDIADEYIAAARHYGNKSSLLLKHYAEDLGFYYLSAKNKDEYTKAIEYFFDKNLNKSIILEVFTDSKDESDALYAVRTIVEQSAAKKAIKVTLGEKNYQKLAKLFRGEIK